MDELSQYDLLVSFCGRTFDVPMLLAHYPSLPLDQPHIDLSAAVAHRQPGQV
jgi:uncharacterized protein